MAEYNNIIDVTLRADSNIGELKVNDVFVQGSTNRILEVTVIDRNNKLLISDQAKIKVYVIWNPKRDSNRRLINPQGYELNDTVSDYDITVVPMKTSGGDDYSIIRIPFRPEFVHSAGENIMILSIENVNDEGTMAYTTSLVYNVQLNDAYNIKLPSTLPVYDDLVKLLATKANKDFSNLTPDDIAKAKAKLGVGNAETGEQIVALLQKLTGDKRLSYTSLKDAPTPTAPDLSGVANKGLDNVDGKVFKDKGAKAGLLTTDLGNVDEDGFNEKVNKSNLAKDVSNLGKDIGGKANADLTNVDKDVFENKMLETNTGKDVATALNEIDKKADKTLSNVQPEDASKLIRLTGAYKELADRKPNANVILHPEEIQNPIADWSTIPQKELHISYQFNANNKAMNQVLPSVAEGRYILVETIFANFTGCSLTLTPASGEKINGSSLPIVLMENGIQGMLVPTDVDSYEWIPYTMLHESGISISDDNGNIEIGIKGIKFKGATVSNDNGETVVTINSGGIEFVGFDGKTISGSKLTSNNKRVGFFPNLDGSIDMDVNINNGEGLFAKLVYKQPINTDFKDNKLWFTPAYSAIGRYIGLDKNDKAITLQEGDMLDPNITGGSLFHIGMYFEPDGEPIATSDGYVELKVVDLDTGTYALNSDGKPIGVRREYKSGQKIGKEILIDSIRLSGQTRFAFEVNASFAGQIIEISGNSCIYVQLIDKDHLTGVAELMFQMNSGYRISTETRFYGDNFMNFASALIRDVLEVDFSNASEEMGNGLFLDCRGESKISISGYHLIMKDNGKSAPIFSVGKVFDEIDTYEVRGKILNAKVTLTNKGNAFRYNLMEWKGQGKATLPILTGYDQAGQALFAPGWSAVSSKFISEDVISGDHVDNNAFTVPSDAKQIAMILYPATNSIPVTMDLKDFEVDVAPQFSKSIITNTSHISEEHLEYNAERYRSLVSLIDGLESYRYTVDANDTKIPIGVFSGGNGKIVNDNSWSDSGSTDPNKTQGDIKFLTSGEVTISYQAQIYNETTTVNDVNFWIAKVNSDGSFTEVPNSRYATTIEANRVLPKLFTTPDFTFKVKENETYRVFAKSNIPDGFYLECDTPSVPLFRLDYYFNELDAVTQDVIDNISKATEIKFVEDGVEVTGKIATIDVKTGKITITDK